MSGATGDQGVDSNGSVVVFAAQPPDCDVNGLPDECDPDCTHDVLSDICQISAGAFGDCDNDATPDVCEVPHTYVFDNGTSTVVWGPNGGGDFIWLQQYSVLPGRQFISHVVIAWTGFTPEGTPVTLMVYRDPNNDGDPHDAVLVRTTTGIAHDAFGLNTALTYTIYPIQRTFVGDVGRSFFVGAKVSCPPNVVCAAGQSQTGAPPRSWRTLAPFGQGDIVNLNNNTLPLGVQSNHRWALRATSLDCNGNGIADFCDIASGFSLDSNTNGIPDECDHFCAADVTGNSVVNIDDLVVVITHWGQTGPPGTVPGDANYDGAVNIDDLVALVTSWGACS